MLKVGYIGLGLMGKSIARNILKAGFPLVVHNRSQPRHGRTRHRRRIRRGLPRKSPHKWMWSSPTCLIPRRGKSVLGENGILEGAHEGLVYVDNSTIKPASARLIAKKLSGKNVFALDAPVSGGDIGAKNGTLTIMVGGDASALEKVMPVFMAMGKTVTHVGEAGAGQVAKAANQIMVAAQMVAMGELLVFSKKAGVDPRKVVDAIKGGAAQCWTLDVKPPRLFEGNRSPGFKAHMQLKDLKIILETAQEYNIPISGTAENTKLFQQMIDLGMGELDNSAVVGVIEKLAGVKIV
jgi:2-hydroxy-3-oxopropionate reductase